MTFEVKPQGQYDISGIFETAAHSVFAHKSYLVLETEDLGLPPEIGDRLQTLCKQFGIGLITFSKPNRWSTYDEVVPAVRKDPDPREINDFISTQLSQTNRDQIVHDLM